MILRFLTAGSFFILVAIMPSFGQSNQSVLGFDPNFIFNSHIPYAQIQEQVDITLIPTSLELVRYRLQDGNGSSSDPDGLATTLTSITFDITTNGAAGSNIRRLALYQGATELKEVMAPAGTTVTFSGLSVTAFDDFYASISLRASFNTNVHDGDLIEIRITNVTLGAGSQFNPTGSITGGDISASVVTGANATPNNANHIEVIATKLDFTTQPQPYAGINEPFAGGVVEARDQFNNRDLDFNYFALITSPAIVTGSKTFVNGVVDLVGIQYVTPGDGTLTVMANGLTSNTSNFVNGLQNLSIPSSHVDVIHVSTAYAAGGVSVSTNLIGNTSNKVIYGVTFFAPYVDAAGHQPKLTNFKLNFSNPVTNILLNFRIYRSTTPSYVAGVSTDVTFEGGIVTLTNSTTLTVDLSSAPIDLSAPMSFFLMADIDVRVNGSTPSIQVSLLDGGFGTSSDLNIVTTKGSATSSVFGQTYTFFGVSPPKLISSYPYSGQTNVNPSESMISLEFDTPVWSFDQKLTLIDHATSQQFTLMGTNGVYPVSPVSTLNFYIPPGTLLPDHVYDIVVDPGVPATTGIADAAFNMFGGLPPGTLYFETSDLLPPKLLGINTGALVDPAIIQIHQNRATIAATFDKLGIAYYLIVPFGSPPPTNPQIRNIASYPGSYVAQGSFNILETNTKAQYSLIPFSSSLPVGTYDVWLCAEAYVSNMAIPMPIPTSAPYGPASVSFVENGSLPTLTFVVPAPSPPVLTIDAPDISFCQSSYQLITNPIVISEGTPDQFAGPGGQLEMELSSGYEFDVSLLGGAGPPIYGVVSTIGQDFAPGASLSFLSNTKVRVTFTNSGSSSLDILAISQLRIKGSTSSPGSLVRSGGNAIPAIAVGSVLATFSTVSPNVVSFTNSYTAVNGSPTPSLVAIPNNINPTTIALSPTNAAGASLVSVGDFGPSVFSGPGVSSNTLDVTSVPLDTPFDIHLVHTDLNGCVSEATMQYQIFDPFPIINALPPSICTVNPSYPTPFPFDVSTHFVSFESVIGYYQMNLTATIPSTASPQIIAGPAWEGVVQLLPKRGYGYYPASNPIQGQFYYNYNVDDAIILNANSLSGGVVADPYSNFIATTPLGKTYYTGGSLGIVEFTGIYQHKTTAASQLVRKRDVEFFIPAIPVIEIPVSSNVDTADPLNPVGFGGPNNPGTLVFCQNSGNILVYGYPAPVLGTSVGEFTFTDLQSGVLIQQNQPAGIAWIDQANGTAYFNTSLINNTPFGNNYNDIKITYTFRDNNASCASTSYQIIRIAPNPTADFYMQSTVGPHIATPTAACAGESISFSSSPSSIPPGFTIATYAWDFGDGSSSSSVSPAHTYSSTALYVPTLTLTSNWGCVSDTKIGSLIVGQVPSPSFTVSGVSTADNFTFANMTAPGQGLDPMAGYNWDFGDGSTYVTLTPIQVSHVYSTTGAYAVKLTAITQAGCMDTFSLPVNAVAAPPPTLPPGGSGIPIDPVSPGTNPTPDVVTAISSDKFEDASAPGNSIVIGNCYPNPFRESATIAMFFPKSNQTYAIHVALYDMTGKQVSEIRNESMSMGSHQIRLEKATIENCSRGLYLCKTTITNGSANFVVTQKVILE